ncbi:YggS family pyridoxal phosphate-dependent enzyme [Vicingaceae bacterium]|nr:YggS family pyridoxal phosphate-dependent enzyme [Vicingaceae bacterium]MDB4062327.1 YggS family pyridoxal phosphate-dependent enzyme [Vicingaceae bacterium]
MSIAENLQQIKATLKEGAELVAVSKTKPSSDIEEAYAAGQRIFGENRPQEMKTKAEELPKDIEWHMIGHLQSKKTKYIAPFVSLIHSVDKLSLLQEINKRAAQNDRIINVLLQVYIAKEESKFGMDESEVTELLNSEEFKSLKNVKVVGLMGMATNTNNKDTIQNEFKGLKTFFDTLVQNKYPKNIELTILSTGMSGDYHIAMEEGSNMVRIGSSIFGSRG